jgi:phenylalanyl-tRNA synthetase beta chain
VVEREALGVLCGGAVGTPWEGRRELDLFDLKGVLEAVAGVAGKRLEARPGQVHGLLPGTAAELYIEGRRVGVLGRLAEDDEHYPLYAAEIELAALESASEELYAALAVDSPPRLPGIQVDHTLTHPVAVAWADLESAIREHAAEELRRFRLENRYEGKGVPEGAVNTTIHFLYHGGERQLTQDEVNRHQEALVAVLEERFGWKAGQEDS